jgi:hypothetical protein
MHGLRITTESGESLMYTSTKPISAKKERTLILTAFGKRAGKKIISRLAKSDKAEKTHANCS